MATYDARARRFAGQLVREARRRRVVCDTRAMLRDEVEAVARELAPRGLAGTRWWGIIDWATTTAWDEDVIKQDLLPEQAAFLASIRAEAV